MNCQMKLICTVCPQGCEITVKKNDEGWHVEGNRCKRGREFALQETISPMRVLTTSVWIEGGDHKLVSVKTDRPIPKEKIGEAIGELCDITINAPVGRGDIIIKNIADTDANIIATRDVRLSS